MERALLLLLLQLLFLVLASCGVEIDEISDEFSVIRKLWKYDVASALALHGKPVTVFAPTDGAFALFRGTIKRNTASYHVVEGVYDLPKFGASFLESVVGENPPVWVTERDFKVYVNNALILDERVGQKVDNGSQVLYAIDEVLDPMVKDCSKPTAHDLITRTSLWTDEYVITSFLADVIRNRLEDFFAGDGKHTFFLPVDDDLTNATSHDLNIHAIKAHVIPNRVLFTRPSEKAYWFRTLASGDYISVFASLIAEKGKYFAVGETVHSDFGNQTGVVAAEIVFPNVPLRNGVAHLISKPLAVFARPPVDSPNSEVIDKFSSDPTLNISYYLGARSGFNENFNGPNKFTFFVPKNSAWDGLGDKLDVESLTRPDRQHIARTILERHLVVGELPVSMETLEKVSAITSCVNLTTPNGKICLGAEKVRSDYVVTWGGVRALVSRPNYECSDGIVHIIDVPLLDAEDFDEFEERHSLNFVRIWKAFEKLM